jgi:hypothetical protein
MYPKQLCHPAFLGSTPIRGQSKWRYSNQFRELSILIEVILSITKVNPMKPPRPGVRTIQPQAAPTKHFKSSGRAAAPGPVNSSRASFVDMCCSRAGGDIAKA